MLARTHGPKIARFGPLTSVSTLVTRVPPARSCSTLKDANSQFNSSLFYANTSSHSVNRCGKKVLTDVTAAKRYYALIPGTEFLEEEEEKSKKDEPKQSKAREILLKCLETAGLTLASLSMLALAGWGYQEMYHKSTVTKIENAFRNGDPAYALSIHSDRTGGEHEGWYV